MSGYGQSFPYTISENGGQLISLKNWSHPFCLFLRLYQIVSIMPRTRKNKGESPEEASSPGAEHESDSGIPEGLDNSIVSKLIASIHRIKGQKQRPGEERICTTMSNKYGIAPEVTLDQLEKAVSACKVVKLINKGLPSYRDPATVPQAKGPANSADIHRMIKKSILLINLGGCTLKEIEEKICIDYGLILTPELSDQIKTTIARMVEKGDLERKGRLVKVAVKVLEPFPSPKARPNSICSFCLGTEESNRDKQYEQLLSCHECGNSGHPSCLKYSKELVEFITAEPWLCLECKKCIYCNASANADDLLICDACDKGFHMICLDPPISSLPEGRWVCPLCVPPPNRRRGPLRGSITAECPPRKKARKSTLSHYGDFVNDFEELYNQTPSLPRSSSSRKRRKKSETEDPTAGHRCSTDGHTPLPPGVTESDLALFKKAQEKALQVIVYMYICTLYM